MSRPGYKWHRWVWLKHEYGEGMGFGASDSFAISNSHQVYPVFCEECARICDFHKNPSSVDHSFGVIRQFERSSEVWGAAHFDRLNLLGDRIVIYRRLLLEKSNAVPGRNRVTNHIFQKILLDPLKGWRWFCQIEKCVSNRTHADDPHRIYRVQNQQGRLGTRIGFDIHDDLQDFCHGELQHREKQT